MRHSALQHNFQDHRFLRLCCRILNEKKEAEFKRSCENNFNEPPANSLLVFCVCLCLRRFVVAHDQISHLINLRLCVCFSARFVSLHGLVWFGLAWLGLVWLL